MEGIALSTFAPCSTSWVMRLFSLMVPRMESLLPELRKRLLSAYAADLLRARDILQQAYEFDATVVENW